ncbi:hemerythrin domain-containing protein [Jiella sonneratiae]|uniref:Hemerythrin domain-containing protein n=1 Tax=Jiella sonneratiae TaxID=2816856 RepID=A0ABS3J2D4_9HYPH|nr:hemerythrin domain-containing protein [Jiella sonneratiae]MBO0903834.1 hemerythrin domain-containing protein [Jiella sonneratiae]
MMFQPRSCPPFGSLPQAAGEDTGAVVTLHPAARRPAPAAAVPLPQNEPKGGPGAPRADAAEDVAASLAALRVQLAGQRRLCDALEAIADGLPDGLDGQRTLHVARQIRPTIRQAHVFEETTIFPLMRARFSGRPELATTLERLHFEHFEDESFAEELSEKLIEYVRRRAAMAGAARSPVRLVEPEDAGVPRGMPAAAPGVADPVAEVLGYMLRGFFEGLRRHIAFEEEHLLPLLATGGEPR